MMRSELASTLMGRIFFENGSGIFGKGAGLSRFLFGLGSGGVEQFCTLYTSLPPTRVAASLNFWSYRMLEGGILGVLLPAFFFFLLLQNCFSLMTLHRVIGKHTMALAGISAVVGVLVFSFFHYVWYDYATLVAFFLATALVAADARYQRAKEAILKRESMSDGSAAELEYYGKAR
jgi:hypothetical protein